MNFSVPPSHSPEPEAASRHPVANGPPKIFHVDVEAVLLDGDPTTNVSVESSDHVFVGETRRASFARLLPNWIRPAYQQLVGLMPKWE